MRILSQELSNVFLNASLICIFGIQRLMVGLVRGSDTSDSSTIVTLCTIRKPFVWHRDEGTSLASVK